jgi:hypothetical protein
MPFLQPEKAIGISVPSECNEGQTGTGLKVRIGNEIYDFVVNSGVTLSLVQPYVGKGT